MGVGWATLHAVAPLGVLRMDGAAAPDTVVKQRSSDETANKNTIVLDYALARDERGGPPHYLHEILPEYRERGACIPLTENRAITSSQWNRLWTWVCSVLDAHVLIDGDANSETRGERITIQSINMYTLNHNFVMPLTAPFGCSFTELPAKEKQLPMWFVSHVSSRIV